MSCIKFAYPFPKLLGDTARPILFARLLQIIPIDTSDLTAEMLDYDTASGAYPLPQNGKYLLLIFQKTGAIHLFTTLRKHTPEKLEFYQKRIGEWFTVKIETT